MLLGGEPRRFSLEVRFDQTPIEGRLYAEDGALVRPFSGWLGLMAAIDAASTDSTGAPQGVATIGPRRSLTQIQ
jgi:hypothetical protein